MVETLPEDTESSFPELLTVANLVECTELLSAQKVAQQEVEIFKKDMMGAT